MFNDLVESTRRRTYTRTLGVFAATAVGWVITLASVIVVGIALYDAKVNADFERESLDFATPPPAPAPPPRAVTASSPSRSATAVAPTFTATRTPPVKISPPRPGSPQPTGGVGVGPYVPGSPVGPSSGADIWGPGFSSGAGSTPAPPPPSPPPAVEEKPPVPKAAQKVSEGVLVGKAVRRVQPPYPAIAKNAGVGGQVVVEVTVSEQGQVLSARVLSGHPLLREAAARAARQWVFSPTLLSREPVKVIGTITFNFVR